MTPDEFAAKTQQTMLTFANKLGEYQKLCIDAGFYAAQGRISEGRAKAAVVNDLQEEMIRQLVRDMSDAYTDGFQASND